MQLPSPIRRSATLSAPSAMPSSSCHPSCSHLPFGNGVGRCSRRCRTMRTTSQAAVHLNIVVSSRAFRLSAIAVVIVIFSVSVFALAIQHLLTGMKRSWAKRRAADVIAIAVERYPAVNGRLPTKRELAFQHLDDTRCEGPRLTSNDDLLPKTIERVEPDLADCRDVYTGNPVLSARIGIDGRLHDIRLVRSVSKCVDDAAVVALQQWRFCPASHAGHPIEMTMRFTVNINYR